MTFLCNAALVSIQNLINAALVIQERKIKTIFVTVALNSRTILLI